MQDIYCDLVLTLSEKCVASSLLEMWGYDEALICLSGQQEILNAVNLLTRSYDKDFSAFLDCIERNSSGHIVYARTSQVVQSIS